MLQKLIDLEETTVTVIVCYYMVLMRATLTARELPLMASIICFLTHTFSRQTLILLIESASQILITMSAIVVNDDLGQLLSNSSATL